MSNLENMIQWFESKKGKVTYSMNQRYGPNSYDCSSAIYYALIAGGFLPSNTLIGNTDSLYRLEGTLLQPIRQNEVRRGDLFIAGVKNGSGGSGGHTGIFTSPEQILHCNYTSNGIQETQAKGRMGDASGLPVYFYRLKTALPVLKTVVLPKSIPGYITADDALKKINSKTNVPAGTYYIFNSVKDAINVTKINGTPGSWIELNSSAEQKKYAIGDKVTLLSKATHYQTGQNIPHWVKNSSFTIVQAKTVNQSNSRMAYLLKEIMSWVLEQDIG